MRLCASEARAAFGDDAVYVERAAPARAPRRGPGARRRLGDGGTVVLGDRDCSAQRSRQKLVEIAPAPALPDDVRAALHDAATRLVAAYAGLATVEFLVADGQSALLEVNPRIQVEHTVTEETTGLDLVEAGLRVAHGETLADLGLTATPAPRGTALQVRVNTETVAADGTVTSGAGTLVRFQPPSGRGVRVDTHGYTGFAVGPRYDSLLAKVIVTAGSVAQAAVRARRALAELDVDGVPVNVALLRALLDRPELVDGHPRHRLRRRAPPGARAGRRGGGAGAGGRPRPAPRRRSSTTHGVVVAIEVAEGDVVPAGAELVVLEAMKMQHVVARRGRGPGRRRGGEGRRHGRRRRARRVPRAGRRRRRPGAGRHRDGPRPRPRRPGRVPRPPRDRPRRGTPGPDPSAARGGPAHRARERRRPARPRQLRRVRRAHDRRPARAPQRRRTSSPAPPPTG